MKEDDIKYVPDDHAQLKKYAEDLINIYKSEKEKRKDLENLNKELLDNRLKLENEIEERKEAEKRLEKLQCELEAMVQKRTAQLEVVNRDLESFNYTVSHDLRAPLRHINSFATMLRDYLENSLDEKSRHYLEVIISASVKMERLINDLLSFSQIGKKNLAKTIVDLNQLIKEIIADLDPDKQGRDISFSISPLPEIQADQSLLRVVYSNLILNAIKFTSKKEKALIEIGFTEDDHGFIFFIRDNGAGFDMKHAHEMFGVFKRLHCDKDYEGTGIGLAIIRQIIGKHGGRTWAEGETDKGATFYFSLPKK